MSGTATRSSLRAGDWVEVRSKEEILATLDKKGQLDGMPFMPEMFDLCGKSLRVGKVAHKTCDTITKTGGRRVVSAVHLEGISCPGKAYDGCDAACLIFWREEWLKPAGAVAAGASAPVRASSGCTEKDVVAATRGPVVDGSQTYVCQATELLNYTSPLPWWDVRQYADDYRTGNVDVRRLVDGFVYAATAKVIGAARHRPRVQGALIAVYDWVQARRGGVPFPRKTGTVPAGEKTPTATLDLHPGELVRVRPHKEILKTLDASSKNRGLYFDAEHVPYCGNTYRVRSRVNKIVDERTGKMLEFKNASVILDGVHCRSFYSDRRMFCPREICSYWREIWLERAETTAGNGSATASPTAGVA